MSDERDLHHTDPASDEHLDEHLDDRDGDEDNDGPDEGGVDVVGGDYPRGGAADAAPTREHATTGGADAGAVSSPLPETDEDSDDDDDVESAEDAASGEHGGGLDDGGDEVGGGDATAGAWDEAAWQEREAVNAVVAGTVTLHYPSRDVRLPFDGRHALELLHLFQARAEGWGPRVSPQIQSAGRGWLVCSLDGPEAPLAVSWMPRQGTRPPARTAIDPVFA